MSEYLKRFGFWLRDHEDSWWGIYAFILWPIVDAIQDIGTSREQPND